MPRFAHFSPLPSHPVLFSLPLTLPSLPSWSNSVLLSFYSERQSQWRVLSQHAAFNTRIPFISFHAKPKIVPTANCCTSQHSSCSKLCSYTEKKITQKEFNLCRNTVLNPSAPFRRFQMTLCCNPAIQVFSQHEENVLWHQVFHQFLKEALWNCTFLLWWKEPIFRCNPQPSAASSSDVFRALALSSFKCLEYTYI